MIYRQYFAQEWTKPLLHPPLWAAKAAKPISAIITTTYSSISSDSTIHIEQTPILNSLGYLGKSNHNINTMVSQKRAVHLILGSDRGGDQ